MFVRPHVCRVKYKSAAAAHAPLRMRSLNARQEQQMRAAQAYADEHVEADTDVNETFTF